MVTNNVNSQRNGVEQIYSIPDNLFSYQLTDAQQLMTEKENRLIISEMGTGKTPICLGVAEMGKYVNILIVCPTTLKFNWRDEIFRWTPENKVAISGNNSANRLDDIQAGFNPETWCRYKIVNYEMFRNDICLSIFKKLPFDLIIMDEVHKLRNVTTKATKAMWEFLDTQSIAKILCVSGSPIVNYNNDIYAPLSFCFPNTYSRSRSGYSDFSYRYTMSSSGRNGTYIYGNRNSSGLKMELEPRVIKHTKEEVLKYLPEKYYKRVQLEMDDTQRELYEKLENFLFIQLDNGATLHSPGVLATLIRLRQINLDPRMIGVTTESSKTDYLVDLVESSTEKIVIFSTFEQYISFLSENVFNNVKHVVISGKTSMEDRAKNVKDFQTNPDIKLCLATIKVGGEGITLTASSTVVLIDRWWNEPSNQQAIDRLHRIGQKNGVQVIYPINTDSIDDTLDKIIARKLLDNPTASNVQKMVIEERRRAQMGKRFKNTLSQEEIEKLTKDVKPSESDLEFVGDLENIISNLTNPEVEPEIKPEEKVEEKVEILLLESPKEKEEVITPKIVNPLAKMSGFLNNAKLI